MAFEEHLSEDLLAAYAVGALSHAEGSQVAEHLRICAGCRLTSSEFTAVAELLPYGVELHAPPPELLQRLMTRVSAEQRPRRIPAWAATAVAAALVAALGTGAVFSFRARSPRPGTVTEWRAMELAPTAAAPGATARLTALKTNTGATRLVLEASNLPRLQGTQAYQMWRIYKGQRWDCGTFTVDGSGHAMLTYDLNGPADGYGITLEPDADGTQPRGIKVLGVSM